MKFCSYCGRQLNEGEACTCPGAQEAQTAKKTVFSKLPMEKVKKLAIPGTILLVVIIAVICLVSYFQTQIDLADYIVIKEVTGLNGQGILSFSLDKKALTKALVDEDSFGKIDEENYGEVMLEAMQAYELADKAIDAITLAASQKENLSNGDTLRITATFENSDSTKFPYHFKKASIEYTVSGLAEGKHVDPFAPDCVSVLFGGLNTYGEACVQILSREEPYTRFRYVLSNTTDLSNGDTVTLYVDVDGNVLTNLGYYMPETLEKTYTVSGLEEGKLFDPFAEDVVSVEFSGINTQGEATLKILSEEPPVSLFYYELSETEELCNGGQITLTAYVDAGELMDLGYLVPENLERTYTVEGLTEYLETQEEIPAELLSTICQEALTLSKESEENVGFPVTVPSVIQGAFFLKVKDPNEPYVDYWRGYNFNNLVAVAISYTVDYGGGINEQEQWIIWLFPNLSADAEGTVMYQAEPVEDLSGWYAGLDEAETRLVEKYTMMTVEKIDIPVESQ